VKISKRQEEIVKQTLQHAVVAVQSIPNAAIAGFIPHLREAQALLTSELKAWELKQDGAQRYTAHTKRSALAQLDAALEEIESLGPAMENTLIVSGTQAAGAGLTAMQQQLASLNAMFEGAMVPVSFDRAAILSAGNKLLVKKYPASAARYAGKIRDDVKRHLAVGTLQQKTITQMANGMYAEIPGVFKSAKFNAMRLVRTEVMNNYNDAHYQGLLEANEEDDEVKMRWDASYDPRRCPECASLDGKIVEVDKDFNAEWNTSAGVAKSRRHRRPPAHPQCRCVLVPWIDDWPDTDWNVDPPDEGTGPPPATYVYGKGAHQIPQKILADEAAAKLKKEEAAKAIEKSKLAAKAAKAQAMKDSIAKQMQEKIALEKANAAKKAAHAKKTADLKAKIDKAAKAKLEQAKEAKLTAAKKQAAIDAAKKKAAAALAKAKKAAELSAKAKAISAAKAAKAQEAIAKAAAAKQAKAVAAKAKAKAVAAAKKEAAEAKAKAAKKAKLSAAAKKGAATKKKKAAKLIEEDKKLSAMGVPALKGKVTGIQKKISKLHKEIEAEAYRPSSSGVKAKIKKLGKAVDTEKAKLEKVEAKLHQKEVVAKAKAKKEAAQIQANKDAIDAAKKKSIAEYQAKKKAEEQLGSKAAQAEEAKKKLAKAEAAANLQADLKIAAIEKDVIAANAKLEKTFTEIDNSKVYSDKWAALKKQALAEEKILVKHQKTLGQWKDHKAHIGKVSAKPKTAEKTKTPPEWGEAKAKGLEKFVKAGQTYQSKMEGGSYYPTGDEINKAYEIWGEGKKPPGFKAELVGSVPKKQATGPSYKAKTYTPDPTIPPDGIHDDGKKRLVQASKAQMAKMRKEHKEIMRDLTSEQNSAVYSYTGSGYSGINGGLRGTRTLSEYSKKSIKHLDEVYAKTTLKDDHVVYRGVSFTKDFRPPAVGQLWEDKGYGSTSVSQDSKFGGDGHFTIEVPKGTPAMYVSSISAVGTHEKELLLGRGAQYRVVSKETKIVYGRPQHHYLLRVESTAVSRGE